MANNLNFFIKGTDGGYRHLTIINRNSGESVALTSGKFVVQEITLWDPATNIIFYKANTEEDSKVLHIYGIKAVQGEKPYCLTCDLSYKGKITENKNINHYS